MAEKLRRSFSRIGLLRSRKRIAAGRSRRLIMTCPFMRSIRMGTAASNRAPNTKFQIEETVFMNRIVRKGLLVAFALLVFVDSSFATDGYFETGYGIKQEG